MTAGERLDQFGGWSLPSQRPVADMGGSLSDTTDDPSSGCMHPRNSHHGDVLVPRRGAVCAVRPGHGSPNRIATSTAKRVQGTTRILFLPSDVPASRVLLWVCEEIVVVCIRCRVDVLREDGRKDGACD